MDVSVIGSGDVDTNFTTCLIEPDHDVPAVVVVKESGEVLDLTVAPDTDDRWKARINQILGGMPERGVEIVAYDSVVKDNMVEQILNIADVNPRSDALEGAVVALIVTPWNVFASHPNGFDRIPPSSSTIDMRSIAGTG